MYLLLPYVFLNYITKLQYSKVKKRLNRNVEWGTAPQDEEESMKQQMGRLIDYLEQYSTVNEISEFVIGQPKKMNDQFSDIEELIKIFISKLSLKFSGIPIYRYDERFSSKLAFKAMIDAGINKKNRRDKYIVDKISATIILQGYLKSKES